ncbi:MAG: hypothetical protein HY070_03035 [Chloroflexi bacterium]|nr:hypothetical protein [Chloroflexota bacterium]
MLYGKGVWAWQESELVLAIEMARAIDATHIIFRTGSGASHAKNRASQFLDAAPRASAKIIAANLIPLAWIYLHGDDPEGEARITRQSRDAGYRGIVFDVEGEVVGKNANLAALGANLRAAGIDPQILFFSSFPNLNAHQNIPFKEIREFCAGGFFPQAYATFKKSAEETLGAMTYDQVWNVAWGNKPDYYPVLGLYYDRKGAEQLSVNDFRNWADALARRRPSFYSIYRAGVTNRDLWQLLKTLRPHGEQPDLYDWQAASAHAWELVGTITNPLNAFPKKANQVLGAHAIALGDERRMQLNDYAWAWQLWTNGEKTVVLLAQEGKWGMDEIHVVAKDSNLK